MSAKELNERITDYLSNGGQFNPECMQHDKVRDLLIDVQTFLQSDEYLLLEYMPEDVHTTFQYQNAVQWWNEYTQEAQDNTNLFKQTGIL